MALISKPARHQEVPMPMQRKRPAHPIRPIPGASRWPQQPADDEPKPKRTRKPRKKAEPKEADE